MGVAADEASHFASGRLVIFRAIMNCLGAIGRVEEDDEMTRRKVEERICVIILNEVLASGSSTKRMKMEKVCPCAQL